MKKALIAVFALFSLIVATPAPGSIRSGKGGGTATVKGKIYLGDQGHPLANAEIMLMDDKKSDRSDHTVQATTDAEGNFSFAAVAEGKYTISIRSWYDTQEEAPCQLLIAKTAEKDSSVIVMKDQGKFVEQIFIKGFSVKGGKEITRDFDIACKSMFGG